MSIFHIYHNWTHFFLSVENIENTRTHADYRRVWNLLRTCCCWDTIFSGLGLLRMQIWDQQNVKPKLRYDLVFITMWNEFVTRKTWNDYQRKKWQIYMCQCKRAISIGDMKSQSWSAHVYEGTYICFRGENIQKMKIALSRPRSHGIYLIVSVGTHAQTTNAHFYCLVYMAYFAIGRNVEPFGGHDNFMVRFNLIISMVVVDVPFRPFQLNSWHHG